MKITFHVLRKELSAIRLFMSTDETRLVLNGVYFEVGEGEILMVATDGRAISVIKSVWENASGKCAFTMPDRMLAILDLKAAAEEVQVTYDSESGIIEVTHNELFIKSKGVEQSYPNWRALFPAEISEHKWPEMFFDPELLRRYEQAGDLMGGDGLRIKFIDAMPSAVLVQLSQVENFIGLLMPMRNSKPITGIPAWLRLPVAKGVEKV